MANMPGQNEQPKPASGSEKQPGGHHSPGTQQPQNWAQGPGGSQQEYTPPEPKRREDDKSGRREPSANPERAPQHTPGYEEQHKDDKGMKEGEYKDEQDRNTRVKQGGRSQADDSQAEREARDDEKALHDQKGQRARTAARKHDVKRKTPAKKPVRKHK